MLIMTIITIIAFSGGFFDLFQGGEVVQKISIVILALAVIVIKKKSSLSRRALVVVWPFIAYLIIASLSAFEHSYSIVYTLAAINSLLLCLIIYVWASNPRLGFNHLRGIRRLTYAIILIEFVFVLVKFVVHGIGEKVLIGTMSNTAGQIGFLFPAIVVPILIFMMGNKYTLATYALVAAMFLFGIINGKRAVVYLLPFILLASIAVNNTGSVRNLRRVWFRICIGGLIGISGAVIGLYAIPSLNPQEVLGGDISFRHAFDYAIDYLTMDYDSSLQGSYEEAENDTNVQVGRVTLWKNIIDWLRHGDTWTLFFGIGFGTATQSIWLHEEEDLLFNIIGDRGGISGAGLALVETGLIGVLIIGYFFFHIFLELAAAYRHVRSNMAKRWFRTLMIVNFVFCFDFFFYSLVLLRTLPIPFIFFVLLASISLVRRWDDAFFKREFALANPRGA